MLVLATAFALVTVPACRKHQPQDTELTVPIAGEPNRYSATIIRTIDDGTKREVSTSREFRSGELRREEWIEEGRHLALIRLPDPGKAFLLDLDAKTYEEIESASGERDTQLASHAAAESNQLEAIDRAVDDAPTPEQIETLALPDQLIDGHSCSVYEQRARFPDGHTEITRTFGARDLAGLLVRVESLSDSGTVAVITERRDVSTDVADDIFTVPADYRKIEKAAR
jgi:hypothetical protein